MTTPEGWGVKRYSDMLFRCGREESYSHRSVEISQADFIDMVKKEWPKILSMNQPSVDRIDNNQNYKIGNIAFVEHTVNSGKDKAIKVRVDGIGVFESMAKASEALGVTKNSIFLAIKRQGKCKGRLVTYAS